MISCVADRQTDRRSWLHRTRRRLWQVQKTSQQRSGPTAREEKNQHPILDQFWVIHPENFSNCKILKINYLSRALSAQLSH